MFKSLKSNRYPFVKYIVLSDFLKSIKTSSFVELGPMVNILVVRMSLFVVKRYTNCTVLVF